MRVNLTAGCLALTLVVFPLALFSQHPPFDVASVKPSPPGAFRPPNFPLDAGDAYAVTDGRFSADFPLLTYITFAYKLTLTQDQRQVILAHLPKWAATDSFDIQARAPESNPTKDQMRMMVQSLLADRFKLAVHFETQTVPVFALVLAKPGKTGPQLRSHAGGPPCDGGPGNGAVFPAVCDVYAMEMQPNRTRKAGSRNTTTELLAGAIPSFGSVSRPVLDQTGLSGRFDFTIEWMPESNSGALPNADGPTEPAGPTFLEALSEQLGLKLEATKAPIQILVVDHVERPSEN
jgi:bla regulator protein BlaR1